MRHPRRSAGTCVTLALVILLGPTPASAETPRTEGSTRTSNPLHTGPSAGQLNAQVRQQQALLAAQQQQLSAAQAQAAAALEACQAALRAAQEAERRAELQAQRLEAATAAAETARERLATYVGRLYRTGMVSRSMPIYLSLLESRSSRGLFTGLALADRVGGNQGNLSAQLAEAQDAQAFAVEKAVAARAAARDAQHRAAAAVDEANRAVAVAAALTLDRELALLRTQAAAAAAVADEQRRASLLARAERVAQLRAATPDPAIDGARVPRPHAACKGQPTDGYQNGRIPPEALCRLWGTRGQMLRADAAAAFDDMSRAYAEQFGAPICVTDSYRSYEEQVAVAEDKPDLAAEPGTSNHGWGLATDLCDGVQQFGTPTHRWMQDNSMLFGWFLPAWAQQGGSTPEPWHWEFAG